MTLEHAYATVAQLRTHMTDDNSVAPNEMLERALNTASRWIDRVCGRRFWADGAVTVRQYRPAEPDIAWVDDISSTTGLIVVTDPVDDGTFSQSWTLDTDFVLEPNNADSNGSAYAWWRLRPIGDLWFPVGGRRRSLKVTALHGWSAVPPDIEEACLLRAYSLFMRRNSPTGIQGFDGFGMRTTKLDPDVAALLAPFMKIKVGAV